jgi:hypothetical protein
MTSQIDIAFKGEISIYDNKLLKMQKANEPKCTKILKHDAEQTSRSDYSQTITRGSTGREILDSLN